MPPGTWLQFRYDKKWVQPSILNGLADRRMLRKIDGAKALVAYIDQADKTKRPEVIPCRTARVVQPILLGRTVSLQLQLEEYAEATDLGAFEAQLASLAKEPLPNWNNGSIQGCYWLELSSEPTSMRKSLEMATWERIVEQIAEREEFRQERFLYTIESVVDQLFINPVTTKRNSLRLAPNREYEVRLYHYHPNEEGDPDTVLDLATSHASVSFTTNPEMILDSRYDLKRVRFHTSAPNTRERGIISVRRRRQDDHWDWELDLPFQIRGVFLRKVGIGLLIGLFLAGPAIVAAVRDADLSTADKHAIAAISLLLGIAAGITAAFGLRRSL
jgi:hypothetical protein